MRGRDGNQKTKLNGELETAYEYDNLGRLTSETEVNGNTYLYDYDAFSNRSSLTVSGIDNYTTAYEYDLNNRLLTETRTDKDCTEVGRYSYDNNGSQIRRASEVTEGKKPWSKPEKHLFVTEPKKNGKATLDIRKYNGFGQLIEIYRDAQRIDFLYRPDGMRHSKTVTHPFKPLLDRKTTHIWDGQNIVLETNQNDEIKAKYLRGFGLIAQVIGEDLFYYLHNAHGDVVQRISENGASAPQYKYDAFGNQRDIVDTDPNPFRYCGEYFDIETQNLYLRARYYDTRTGRFSKEDPAKANGRNWYTYCINNPIMFKDPTGLISQEDINAYKEGKMTDAQWSALLKATRDARRAKAGDYTTLALSHWTKARIRNESYDPNYIENDDFDYTFGTGYSTLDFGEEGKYVKTMVVFSEDGTAYVVTQLFYERLEKDGKFYLKLDKAAGYARGTDGNNFDISIDGTCGQNDEIFFSSEHVKISSSNSSFSVTPNFSGLAADDQCGTATAVGMNLTFNFISGDTEFTLEVFHGVYYSYWIDENGKLHEELGFYNSEMLNGGRGGFGR